MPVRAIGSVGSRGRLGIISGKIDSFRSREENGHIGRLALSGRRGIGCIHSMGSVRSSGKSNTFWGFVLLDQEEIRYIKGSALSGRYGDWIHQVIGFIREDRFLWIGGGRERT